MAIQKCSCSAAIIAGIVCDFAQCMLVYPVGNGCKLHIFEVVSKLLVIEYIVKLILFTNNTWKGFFQECRYTYGEIFR